MARLPVLAFAIVFTGTLLSCGAPVDRPELAKEAVAATSSSILENEHDAPADAADVDSVVPEGAFATIEALCAAQMTLAAPGIEQSNAERAERYDGAARLEPSCIESPSSFVDVTVHVGAPFDDVRAITVETGTETNTHLVVHSAEGWRATLTPVVSTSHDDMGCPGTRRDGPLHEVRVERGALIVVGTSDRGDGEEALDDDPEHILFVSRVFEDAMACRVERGALRCDPKVTIRANRMGGSRPPETVFATSYVVDEVGHIRPKTVYVDRY